MTTSSRTWRPLAVVTVMLACAPAPDASLKASDTGSPDDPTPIDTPTPDTPSDTPADTLADTPTETPAGDTAPETPRPTPPSWGAGFSEVLLGTLLADGATAPPSSIANRELGELVTVLPADLDADGTRELIVSEVLMAGTAPNWHAVYRPDGAGGWTYDATLSARLRPVRRGVVGALDLDDDGAVDLLRASFESPITLARGATFQGQLPSMPDGLRPLGGYQRVGVADLDRDGWIDVWFLPNSCSNTTARGALAFFRTGLATWSWIDGVFPEDLRPNAYALGAFPGFDGAPDRLLWVASGCEAADHPSTVLEPAGTMAGRTVWGHVDPFPMNSVFRYDPTAPFMPLGARQPMGAALTDLHGDGVFEYLVSLSDPHLHGFSTGPSAWTDLTPTLADALPIGPNQVFQLPWAIGPIDLDRDGRPDAVVVLGDDMDAFTAPVRNGPYTPMALWNDGLGHLVDVSPALPLGRWRPNRSRRTPTGSGPRRPSPR